jgi:hypothetical protein
VSYYYKPKVTRGAHLWKKQFISGGHTERFRKRDDEIKRRKHRAAFLGEKN